MTLIDQFEMALKEYQIAENHFNFADFSYLDSAIFNLTASEMKLNGLIQEIRREPKMAPVEKRLNKFIQNYFNTRKEHRK